MKRKFFNFFHFWSLAKGTIDTFFVLYNWAKTFVSPEKLYEMFFIQKNKFGQTPFYITMTYDFFKKNEWESLLTRVSVSLSIIDFKKLLLERS